MRIVVVGAGISGLAAAYTLRGHDVTVLDAASEVGGRMRSELVGGATMELGAQFLSSGYDVIPRLAQEVGLRLRGVAPGTAVVRHGALRRFRSDAPLSQFTGGVLPWRSALRAAAGLPRTLRSVSGRPTSDLTAWADLGAEPGDAWARRVLGSAVTDGLLEPTINGFYFQSLACNSAALAAAVASFGAHPGSALTIDGGLVRLPLALAACLEVRLDTPVLSVERAGDDEAVVRTASEELRADRVVVALPGAAAAEVLREPTDPERDLMATPYSTGLVVGIPLARRLGPRSLADAYGVLVHPDETTPLAAVAVASRAHSGTTGTDLLTVMFRHDAATSLVAANDSIVATGAVDALAALVPSIRIALPHEVSGARVVRHPQAMPTCPPGHPAAVAAYRATPQPGPVVLAGDYLGFPWTDSAAATGIWAAEQALSI